MTLGELLRARRKAVGLTQEAVARQVPGLTRGALNNIENNVTKGISPDVANAIVKVLPVTMGEVLRAMGYDLPVVSLAMPDDIAEGLEGAPPPVLDAVRLLVAGYRRMQQVSEEAGEPQLRSPRP